ncbi:acyltransferase, partial [Pelagibacteraceae bacterium]|nr:acyltransferase [Pelagibacteraceae bacterium]
FSQSLIAVSFFVSNFFFWKENADYFGGNVEQNPLIHTWSLAVEEQFYIFFPIFLLMFWRFGKSKIFQIICIVVIVSLVTSEWLVHSSKIIPNQKEANFYLIFTRAWELLVGSIAALMVKKKGVSKNEIMPFIGLFAIFFSIFTYSKNTPIPSFYALVPVLGTVLILLYAQQQTFVAKLLSIKVFVFIGLISYSSYLWHQPLFAFAKLKFFEVPSIYFFISLSLVSLALGALSWKYIEQPFRKRSNFNIKQILTLSLCFIFFFSIFGYIGHQKEGFAFRFEFKEPKSPISGNKCHGTPANVSECLKRNNYKKNIFVLGDSHGSQTFTAIKNNLSKNNNVQINYVSKKNLKNFPYSFLNFYNPNIYSDHTLNVLFENLRENDLLIISIHAGRIKKKENAKLFKKNMKVFLNELEKKGTNVILQLDNPTINSSKWLHCYKEFKKFNKSSCGISNVDYAMQIKDLNVIYKELCNQRDWCNVLAINKLYFNNNEWFEPMKNWSYVDLNHLSKYELDRLGNFYKTILIGDGFIN